MITAVDTNVLLDVLGAAPPFADSSSRFLRRCLHEGLVVASDVVWAETVPWFASRNDHSTALATLGIGYLPTTAEAAAEAGAAWGRYRASGGPGQRLVADFLVGAHDERQADRLLTRDRGFFRRYLAALEILDPT